jgi:hypothetical protein
LLKIAMSHGIKRQRESPEKEAARVEKEKSQISEYRALVEDIMLRVHPHAVIPSNANSPAKLRRLLKKCIRLDHRITQEEPRVLYCLELPTANLA